jgi:hypothetical protein
MRFVHAGVVLVITLCSWIASQIKFMINPPSTDFSSTNVILVAVALFASFLVLVLNLRRSEAFYRDQFLRYRFSTNINNKLINQLKALQRRYSAGVVDIETPLEKSMATVRSLMADPDLRVNQVQRLEQLLQLLNSPSLLTPDFESQLRETFNPDGRKTPSMNLDKDQKTWLLTVVSKRNSADPRQRRQSIALSAKKKRRNTIFAMDLENGQVPDVPSLPKQYETANSLQQSLQRGTNIKKDIFMINEFF